MVVTRGSVVYGSLVMNVASTIRAVRLMGRADSRIDSLRLVKTLFATLGTSRHFAALYYHSALGAVQKIGVNILKPTHAAPTRGFAALPWPRALHVTKGNADGSFRVARLNTQI
jgi:hypothetical protein